MTQETRTISFLGAEIEVEFDYYQAHRGAREHGTGLQLTPDEPATLEVSGAKLVVMEDNAGEILNPRIYADLGELIDIHFDAIAAQIMEERSDDEPDQGY